MSVSIFECEVLCLDVCRYWLELLGAEHSLASSAAPVSAPAPQFVIIN